MTSNPEILDGALVFNGTHVPVRRLFDYLKAGDSIKEFLDDFPTVSFGQVSHVLQSAEIAIETEAPKENTVSKRQLEIIELFGTVDYDLNAHYQARGKRGKGKAERGVELLKKAINKEAI